MYMESNEPEILWNSLVIIPKHPQKYHETSPVFAGFTKKTQASATIIFTSLTMELIIQKPAHFCLSGSVFMYEIFIVLPVHIFLQLHEYHQCRMVWQNESALLDPSLAESYPILHRQS